MKLLTLGLLTPRGYKYSYSIGIAIMGPVVHEANGVDQGDTGTEIMQGIKNMLPVQSGNWY